jgi:hypothetical protein
MNSHEFSFDNLHTNASSTTTEPIWASEAEAAYRPRRQATKPVENSQGIDSARPLSSNEPMLQAVNEDVNRLGPQTIDSRNRDALESRLQGIAGVALNDEHPDVGLSNQLMDRYLQEMNRRLVGCGLVLERDSSPAALRAASEALFARGNYTDRPTAVIRLVNINSGEAQGEPLVIRRPTETRSL